MDNEKMNPEEKENGGNVNNDTNISETSLLERYIQRKMVYNIHQLDEKEIAQAIRTLLQSKQNFPKHLH